MSCGPPLSLLAEGFDLFNETGVQELLQDPGAAAAGDVQKLGQGGSGDHGIIVHLEQAHDPQKIALIDAVFLGVGQSLGIGVAVI